MTDVVCPVDNKGFVGDVCSLLPDDILLADVLPMLTSVELAHVELVSTRFQRLASTETLWEKLFADRWGTQHAALNLAAAKKAGGYHHLWAAKHKTDLDAAPWQKPCTFEVAAAVEQLVNRAAPELCVCFLLDGSGSVHDEDFDCARTFIQETAEVVQNNVPGAKITVVQFSNDTKVEYAPAILDDTFGPAMTGMVRMNGGTNIAVAIQRAGQLLKRDIVVESSRCVVLITDGRVDTYQAKEARQMAERLADEQCNVSFYAFAVGRGVDKAELLQIISANEGETASNRYLDLYVRDEAPW